MFGYEKMDADLEAFREQLTEIERWKLDVDTTTAELEARVEILESEHRDDVVA